MVMLPGGMSMPQSFNGTPSPSMLLLRMLHQPQTTIQPNPMLARWQQFQATQPAPNMAWQPQNIMGPQYATPNAASRLATGMPRSLPPSMGVPTQQLNRNAPMNRRIS